MVNDLSVPIGKRYVVVGAGEARVGQFKYGAKEIAAPHYRPAAWKCEHG